MKIIGKTTIHPVFFYTGKVAGYAIWIILFGELVGIDLIDANILTIPKYTSLSLLIVGLIFTVISLVNLGKSTSLGLPTEETQLKTNGLYNFSRNPMYVGFNLITISAMVYTLSWFVIALGVYSLIVYHLIILGEENFMSTRFGEDYKVYKARVRRYL
jgi:protein-S-isoprenylcysteine O-methyltransferase Ste14